MAFPNGVRWAAEAAFHFRICDGRSFAFWLDPQGHRRGGDAVAAGALAGGRDGGLAGDSALPSSPPQPETRPLRPLRRSTARPGFPHGYTHRVLESGRERAFFSPQQE